MDLEALAGTRLGKLVVRALAAVMESRFRYRFFGPEKILAGADVQPGQVILEIGCGTGYFTLPLAKLVGDQGQLVAMDILSESVELVTHKVQEANLSNVRVIKGDAMDTGLDDESFDLILLFGVIPAPMLPLSRLLPEIHRIVKPEGGLAIWPPIPGWLPKSVERSGLFAFTHKRSGVSNFRRL